ncbi:MAG: tRNA (adenosine(37)-N6)-threonylcarbamoyltransferase complex dimerization subunit type 1 TsaB [Microcystaceae cyanobacterium]
MNPPRYALGIQTTTGQLGLGLSLEGQISRYQVWQVDRTLSNNLHQYLQELMQSLPWQELAYIAVAKGPGSFTSTRIGMVTARTLAQQLNIPLFTISSLAAYGWSQRHQYENGSYMPLQMKSVQGKIYGAIYQLNSQKTNIKICLVDQVLSPEQWAEKQQEFALKIPILQTPDQLGETVVSLLELAEKDWQQGSRPHWSEALPFYGDFS